jgi:hypothetical protein
MVMIPTAISVVGSRSDHFALSIPPGTCKLSEGHRRVLAIAAAQKVFSALWEVESEVNNGGFSQYFVNSSAESAHFVVDALEIIGAPKTADICQRAIAAAFPAGLPESEEAIRSATADFSDEVLEKLEPLDQEFYSYPHNLTDLLFAYVSAHPEEFGRRIRNRKTLVSGRPRTSRAPRWTAMPISFCSAAALAA